MFVRRHFLLFVALLAIVFAVFKGATVWQREPAQATNSPGTPSDEFRKYWFAGKAELSSYTLDQVQYGHPNPGEAVLIFVTEDFRTDRQVKLESKDRGKATTVLKLNAVRKFVTGIYDYSVMTSVFTPVETRLFPHALKATASVQEWCGQTYQQLNLRGRQYHVTGHSYFEKEADDERRFDRAWLEDELWTRLRLDPESLPVGDVEVVPSLLFSRLKHQPLKPEAARASLADSTFQGLNLRAYTLVYPALSRRLILFFERAFPHQIMGWEETSVANGKSLTTRAVRKKTLKIDYWNHNHPADQALRDSLALR
ncbi:MAG: hypothetical protein LH606_10410 [Cytophagaceae bacterium]|nr:hypothetical protein [Cytophagaceae bacterium]